MNRFTSSLSGGDRSASSSPEIECSGRVDQQQDSPLQALQRDRPTLTELCERAESRVDERLYEISRGVKKLEEGSSATNGGGKTDTKTKKARDGRKEGNEEDDVAMRDNGAIEALTTQLSEMRASRRQSRRQRRRRHSATRSYESTVALQESIGRLNAHCRRRGSSSSLSSSSLGMSTSGRSMMLSSGFVGRRSSSSIGGVTCPHLAEGALTDLSDAALLFFADDDDDNDDQAATNKEVEEKKQADDEDDDELDEWARTMVAASFVDMERERQRDRRSIRRSRDSCLGLGVSDEVMAELAALDDSLDDDEGDDREVPMKVTAPVPEEEDDDHSEKEEGAAATNVVASPPSLLKGAEEERESATRSGMANPPRRKSATAATA